MSYLIPDDSPKRAIALRFASELNRALASRGVGVKQVEKALGTRSHTQLHWYRQGRNLPRLRQATLLAEVLAWPMLVEIVREARTKICAVDGRSFVDEGGAGAKRYCSPRCREQASRDRARIHNLESREAHGYQVNDAETVLVARLEQELERVRQAEVQRRGQGGYIRRREVRAALDQYRRAAPVGRRERIRLRLDEHITAVEAFCGSCEPEGVCRNAECPLRNVSPLPYSPMRDVGLAQKAPGRWSQPGAREEASEQKRAWWAGLPPARRREVVDAMAARRYRKDEERPGVTRAECGCPVSRLHDRDCPLAEVAS